MITYSPTTLSLDFVNNVGVMMGEDYSLNMNTSTNNRNMFSQYGGPITFSRATGTGTSTSPGTMIDQTGKLSYATNNLLTYSQQFDNAVWVKSQSGVGIVPSVTPDVGIAPDGTLTADLVTLNKNGGTTTSDWSWLYQPRSFPAENVNYIFSAYVKAYSAGDVGKKFTLTASSLSIITLTDSWQRVQVRHTTTGTATISCGFRIRGSEGTGIADSLSMYVWGVQFEQVTYQTSPRAYIPTTSTIYYGPRFDYDPSTLAAKGLLIEEARTNLFTYSSAYTTSWVISTLNTTGTPAWENVAVSPDGTQNAYKIMPNTNSGYHSIYRSIAFSTGYYTISIYAKAAEYTKLRISEANGGRFYASFDLTGSGSYSDSGGTNFVSASIISVGNGWYRCIVIVNDLNSTRTPSFGGYPDTGATLTNFGVTFTGDGVSGLYLWGAQMEQGNFATSYIPTVASTLTRNADVVTMTGISFSQWYNPIAGTFVAGFDTLWSGTPTTPKGLLCFDGSAFKRVLYFSNNGLGARTFDGVTIVATVNDPTPGPSKVASAYDTSRYIVANGSTVASGTMAPGYNVASSLDIGSYGGGFPYSGHIRSLQYYPNRLPDSVLQTLTT